MKKSSYRKLKKENKRLKNDFDKIYGDFKAYVLGKMRFSERAGWEMGFQMEDDAEKLVWAGESTMRNGKNKQ